MCDQKVMHSKKDLCIMQLAEALPMLRTSLDLSQEEVAQRIGVTRQTYNAIESGRREMSWSTCISLASLFASNEKSRNFMERSSDMLTLMEEILQGR